MDFPMKYLRQTSDAISGQKITWNPAISETMLFLKTQSCNRKFDLRGMNLVLMTILQVRWQFRSFVLYGFPKINPLIDLQNCFCHDFT